MKTSLTTYKNMSYFTVENNIIKTEDECFNADDLGGLGNVYFQFLKKHEDKIAQIVCTTGEIDTYASLLQRITRTAIVLKKKGVNKGDIIMSCSNIHLNECVPVIASYFMGAIPCSMDPSFTLREVTRLIQKVKPKIVFTISEKLEIIRSAIEELNLEAEIVVFGLSALCTEFKTFCEEQKGETEFRPVTIANSKETAAIYFSSGSSGFPKAICLNHYYFLRQSLLVPQHENTDLDAERKAFEESAFSNTWPLLSYSPLCWITGAHMLINSIIAGVYRLLINQFNPREFCYIVNAYKVRLTFLTPFQITALVNYGKHQNVNAEGLLKILTAGAHLPKNYAFALQDLLPNADIAPGYGLTETGMLARFEDFTKFHREYYKTKPNSVGFPIRGVWYKVVDVETEEVLGFCQEGELRVKTDCIMNGYYNQNCQDQFDDEGWFKTGDIVKYDENYCFFVIDRIKEVIKYRSIPVQPASLEQELLKHPSVKQAVVIGKPHEEDGEHPMAVVVLNENCKDITAEGLQTYIEERVLDKERLRGGVKFVDSLPMTVFDKVKRRELKKMILED